MSIDVYMCECVFVYECMRVCANKCTFMCTCACSCVCRVPRAHVDGGSTEDLAVAGVEDSWEGAYDEDEDDPINDEVFVDHTDITQASGLSRESCDPPDVTIAKVPGAAMFFVACIFNRNAVPCMLAWSYILFIVKVVVCGITGVEVTRRHIVDERLC